MTTTHQVPIVHLTDLYCPPEDPDDTLDLATLHALPELDIRAVILDPTRRFLRADWAGGANIQREPGLVTVLQLQHITGRSYPVAIGPADPLRSVDDDATDRSRPERAGVELLLRVLRDAPDPVVITVVSSLRPLAAALNRDPDLCQRKIARVLVNAGNSAGSQETDWNVQLDPLAHIAVWRSGLAIDWYPCTGALGWASAERHTTYWRAPMVDLLDGLPLPLRAWLHYSFAGSGRGDVLRALQELGDGEPWRLMLGGTRNMWSTASLADAAGRTPQLTARGWRFLPDHGPHAYRLEPMTADVGDDASLTWAPTSQPSSTRIFTRNPEIPDHDVLMLECLHDLLTTLPVDGPVA